MTRAGTAADDVAPCVAERFTVTGQATFREDRRTVTVAPGTLRMRLTERIYTRCHLRQPASCATTTDLLLDGRLRDALRARRAGARYLDDGWVLVGRTGDRARVRKDGLTLVVGARELCSLRSDTAGETLQVRLPSSRPRALPGWFVYVSRHGQPATAPRLWRVYGDVRPDHGADAMGTLSGWLEARRARFQLKLLDASALGTRPDGLVAFVQAEDADAAVRCMRRMRLRGWLGDASPGFATRVADGVALAPEPPAGTRSYGQVCAEIAADATIEAWTLGIDDMASRSRLVSDRVDAYVTRSVLAIPKEAPWSS